MYINLENYSFSSVFFVTGHTMKSVWPQTHYLDQAGLELVANLLPLPPSTEIRCVPS